MELRNNDDTLVLPNAAATIAAVYTSYIYTEVSEVILPRLDSASDSDPDSER